MTHTRPPASPREQRIRPPGRLITSIAIFLSGCGVVLVTGGVLMWLNDAVPYRKNDNVRYVASPDGKHQAVWFRRTSKGPRSHTTHVSIIRTGEKLPNRSGKAFIAEGEPTLLIRWPDNRNLVIDEPDGTKVILRAAQLGDIRISER